MLMAPIFFTDRGMSLEAIGLASLLGLPWNFKFIWSPLTDLIGSRRIWVMATLAVLLGAFALLAFSVGLDIGTISYGSLGTLPLSMLVAAGVLLLISFASATADISQDAFYMDALNKKQQAAFIGARVTAYRIAMITASGLLVYIGGRVGWQSAFSIGAVIMGVVVAWNALVLPRPAQSRPDYQSAAEFFAQVGRAFVSYLNRDRVVVILGFILTYKLGEYLLSKMAVPFLMKGCGVTAAQMGIISGVFGIGATIIGAIAGSIWIVRKGLWFSLITITIVMNATNLLYVVLALVESPALWAVTAVHIVENFAGGLGTAAFAYLLIRTCKENFRATHYAIATGLMSLGGTLAGSISGFIAAQIGYAWYFGLCTFLALPGVALLFLLPGKLSGRGAERV